MTEIESVLVDREVDALVGMALAYAADGQLELATEIAEKVERLAPWSPRYLQLQVYLDEEGARKRADDLVARAREHRAARPPPKARRRCARRSRSCPGHAPAARLVEELAGGAAAVASRRSAPRPSREAPVKRTARPAERRRAAAAAAHGSTPAAAPRSCAETEPQPVSAARPAARPAAAPVAVASRGSTAPRCRPAERRGRSRSAPPRSSTSCKDEHEQARQLVERALALDPQNRRALELEKILRVLG